MREPRQFPDCPSAASQSFLSPPAPVSCIIRPHRPSFTSPVFLFSLSLEVVVPLPRPGFISIAYDYGIFFTSCRPAE